MHHGKPQHVKTSNASQSAPLSFVYFYPQLGLKKRFLPSCFMGKNIFLGKLGICHLSGIRHFMRRSHFLQKQHSLLQNWIHINLSQSAKHAELSWNYCIYYSKTKINFMHHRISQHVKTSTPATTEVNTSKTYIVLMYHRVTLPPACDCFSNGVGRGCAHWLCPPMNRNS